MDKEKTISSKRIYEGRVVCLRVDTVIASDGRETIREIVEHAACIGVIPVDENDNVLLVRQYRKAAEKELLEIPAGGIEPGENPEDAVRREMQEETGYMPEKLERIGGMYSSPGHSTEYLHLYVATGLRPSRLLADDTAAIRLVRAPVKDLPGMLAGGAFEDAKSIAGLWAFLERRKR